jgi:hypothetical protein
MFPPHDCGNICKHSRAKPPNTAENDKGADSRQLRTSINAELTKLRTMQISKFPRKFGVPYGSRTRVAAVKEKRPIVIQRNFAAWIALYGI